MPDIATKALTLVSTTTGVNMQTGAAFTLYTVPTGKVFRPVMVIIRDISATLAGGTDYDFTNWLQTVDLSGMTVAGTSYRVLHSTHNTSYTEIAASATFQITPSTGSTGAATATIDVFGYLTT